MKLVHRVLLSITFLATTVSHSQISGTFKVGVGGTFTTLTAAVDSINSDALAGPVVLLLTDAVYTTPAETFPITIMENPGSNSANLLTIRPDTGTAVVITGSSSSGIFRLDGADYVIITGVDSLTRGGEGPFSPNAGEALTIRNTSASGPAVAFINDATNNLITKTTLESANASATSGTVFFGTSTGSSGNSFNVVEESIIRDRTDAPGEPANGIYSSGSGSAPNESNLIQYSEILNYTTAGIHVSSTGNGNGWSIQNNTFYQTALRTASLTGISIQGGGGHSISGNVIGGSDVLAHGSATTITSGTIEGINLAVSTSPVTSVTSNLIANLSNTGSSSPNFNGVIVSAGDVDIINNTIGGTFLPSDTVLTSGDTYGYRNTGSGNVSIINNVFSFVSNYAATPHDLRGIMVTAGTATIRDNSVGSLSDVNAASTSLFMAGITVITGTSGNIIEDNTIFNMHSDGTDANIRVVGMLTGGFLSAPDVSHVRRNHVLALTGNGTPTVFYGIHKLSGDATYSNNMVALGEGQGLDPLITGIRDDGATGTNTWAFNTVLIDGLSDGGAANNSFAFARASTAVPNIKNNIFSNQRVGGSGAHITIANTHTDATGWGTNASDYNILLNGTSSSIGLWLSTGTPTDLATWKTNSSGDPNSDSYPVTFISATDLHINPIHNGDENLKGLPVSGIVSDFDGDIRDTQAPYKGADELSISLPVQLASFTGRVNPAGNGVLLEWRTISEINNYGFYVERRRASEQTFTDVQNSFIPGHGTTNEPHDYSFIDNTLTGSGTIYYRLRQVDFGGTFERTEQIEVNYSPTSVPETAPRVFRLLQNYPNPFNPSTEIKFSVESTGRATLEIYNLLGQKVATLFDGIAEAGQYYRVQANASGFASGMYLYRLQSGAKTDLKKMLLLK